MKKITAIIAAVALCLSLTACGGKTNKAEDVVKNTLDAVKAVNLDKISEYTGYDVYKLEEYKPVLDAISDGLDYNIISTEQKDDNNVVVKTEVTVSDLSPFIGDYLTKMMEYGMSNYSNILSGQISQEETEQKALEMLNESLANADLSNLVTKELGIRVVKDDDKKWKVRVDDSFVSSLSSALFSTAYQNMGNFISEGMSGESGEALGEAMGEMMKEFTTPQ